MQTSPTLVSRFRIPLQVWMYAHFFVSRQALDGQISFPKSPTIRLKTHILRIISGKLKINNEKPLKGVGSWRWDLVPLAASATAVREWSRGSCGIESFETDIAHVAVQGNCFYRICQTRFHSRTGQASLVTQSSAVSGACAMKRNVRLAACTVK